MAAEDDEADDVAIDDPASKQELEHPPVDAGTTANADAGSVEGHDASVLADAGPSSEPDAGFAQDSAVEPTPDAGPDASEVADSGSSEDRFAAVYALIQENCTSCHGAGKSYGDFSTRELAYAQLVGVSAQGKACASDASVIPVRVVAGDPETSLLILKLENRQSCGSQMPKAMLLPQASVDVFRAWVAAGAPQH